MHISSREIENKQINTGSLDKRVTTSPRAKKVKMAKNKGRAFSSKSRDEVSLSTVIV